MRGQKPSALGACVGAVVGLVAITPAAGYVDDRREHLHRRGASVVSQPGGALEERTSTLDDTLDVFPCHGVGGMVGMLLTGVFAKDVGLTSGHATTFLVHCGALVFVAGFSFGGSCMLYKITDLIIPLRVSEEQEDDRPRPQPARRNDGRPGREIGAAAAAGENGVVRRAGENTA